MTKIALGLGSNLGNREQNLLTAITSLNQKGILHNLNISSILNNKAMLLPNSPKEWDIDFLNCVVTGESDLKPEQLLQEVKNIEHAMCRIPNKKWSPRIIDIDILAYDSLHFEASDFTIPHTGLLQRNFAIGLLAEVWPDWKYPIPGEYYQKTALELAQRL